jgi:hypothetical protein
MGVRHEESICQRPSQNKQFRRAERNWENSVKQYTGCYLTFEDDQLATLAGNAKSMDTSASLGQATSARPLNQYPAGLWMSHVNEHLL